MRVLLSRRRAPGERGVIAMMVALVSAMFLVIAAFAADLGMAYTSTRQLQTASDAAALASASEFAKYAGDCDSLRTNTKARADAQTVADTYRQQNRPGSSGTPIVVSCVDGALRVAVFSQGSTPKIFGRVLGGSETIATTRTASADLDVPPGSRTGVRPYALCDLDVPTGALPSAVIEIKQPGQAHTGGVCAEAEAGGNWWFLSCPEDGNGSMSADEIAAAVTNGCAGRVSVVRPQDTLTPGTLADSLTLNCDDGGDRSASCLDGDTGNSSHQNKKGSEAWDTILGKTIILPVFCSVPTCDPDTVSGTGTNSVYPVYKLASVVVCGFHIYDDNSKVSSSGDCVGNSFTSSYVSGLDKKEIRLFLKFVRLQTATDNGDSDCELEAPCDGGLRRVRLTQ